MRARAHVDITCMQKNWSSIQAAGGGEKQREGQLRIQVKLLDWKRPNVKYEKGQI